MLLLHQRFQIVELRTFHIPYRSIIIWNRLYCSSLIILLMSIAKHWFWFCCSKDSCRYKTCISTLLAPHLHCKIDGISCLNKYYNELSILKAPWSNKIGLVCECLPSCTEIELNIITDEKRRWVRTIVNKL